MVMSNLLNGIFIDEVTVCKLDCVHVFYFWLVQVFIDLLFIVSASGFYFTDYEGKCYLDFFS